MSRRHHRRVIFILESGGTEIDEPDFGVEQHFSLRGLAVDSGGGRRDLAVVGEGLVLVVAEEDVLGLQVGMDEVKIVED